MESRRSHLEAFVLPKSYCPLREWIGKTTPFTRLERPAESDYIAIPRSPGVLDVPVDGPMVCGTPRFIYGDKDKEYISGGLPALRGYFSELSKIHQVRIFPQRPGVFLRTIIRQKDQ